MSTTPEQPVRTHCPYCALQCGIRLVPKGEALKVEGDPDFPINKGRLCIKGWTAASALRHPERLVQPLVRNARGVLVAADWDHALERTAQAIRDIQSKHGKDAMGVYGSGALTNEKVYQLGKFARVALGTSAIDYNGRFCMSSAAAGANKSLGIDRGLPFPVEDIAEADVVLLAGGNIAETMPPLMQYVETMRARGGQFIVVDPRRTTTAEAASIHLRIAPATDAALANGLLHVAIRDGLVDLPYIDARTEGFSEARRIAAAYWPERVERLTGVPEAQLVQTVRLLAGSRRVLILTARGAEQHSQGVNNVLSYVNLALAFGLVGRPGSGFGCVTGQGNGQGGREHGQKADQLPGYRRIDDPQARARQAALWGIDEADLPRAGKSAYELLSTMGTEGGVRGLLVMGANPLVSSPNAGLVTERLKALDFLAVADFFLSETASHADVVFPVAQWAEEEGTMTNLEGRVIHRRKAVSPPPGVKTDLELLKDLSGRLGHEAQFPTAEPELLFAELCEATAGGPADYSGMTYEAIDQLDGIQWPCREPGQGTPRLFERKFPTPTGRARFHAVAHAAAAEESDEEFPLILTTGRVLAQYQTGAQTRRLAELNRVSPEPLAQLHPETARRFGLTHGQPVRLASRRGAAKARLEVTSAIREDTVFVPFHWGGEQSINRLTNPALDPISRMPEFKACAVRIEAETLGSMNDTNEGATT